MSHRLRLSFLRIVLTAMLLVLALGQVAALERLAPERVPDPLKPWVGWALHELPDWACPFLHDNQGTRQCQWPGRLTLDLGRGGGTFAFEVRLYRDGIVHLPGSSDYPPQEVLLDGKPAVVVPEGNLPRAAVPTGAHRLTGTFRWDRRPETLAIPPAVALIRLQVDGKAVAEPRLEGRGRLWLAAQERAAGQAEADRLRIRVFRRVEDAVPVRLVTHLELEVSGRPREVLLGPVLLADAVPLRLDPGGLPARLEPDGRLRVVVRPGTHHLEVFARQPAAVERLTAPTLPAPWPEEEIWLYAAHPEVRLAEVVGPPAVDPTQVGLPPAWLAARLPVYALAPGQEMGFKTIRRGDPEPEPDRLHLTRQLKLDFKGAGYTVSDRIQGTMSRAHRLEASERLGLGRVQVDNEDLSITRRPGDKGDGVELRRGQVTLTADGRIEGEIGHLPAVGWAHDFESVTTDLALPPGWRVLAARGVDKVPEAWVERWTLFDFFGVLITAVAIGRLFRPVAGGIALAALALAWHEADAPQWIWLHWLAATALLRVLPAGRIAALVGAYRWAALAIAVLIAVPFAVAQIRAGIYPQLAWGSGMRMAGGGGNAAYDDALRRAEPAMSPVPAQAMNAPASAPASPPVLASLDESQAEGEVADALAESKTEAPPSKPAEAEAAGKAKELAPSPHRALKKALAVPKSMAAKIGGLVSSSEPMLGSLERDPDARVQTGPGLPDWLGGEIHLVWSGPVAADHAVRIFLLSPGESLALAILRVALLFALLGGFAWTHRPGGRAAGSTGSATGSTVPPGATAAVTVGLGWLALLPVLALAVAPRPVAAEAFPPDPLLHQLRERLTAPLPCGSACASIPRLQLTGDRHSFGLVLEVRAAAALAVPLPGPLSVFLPERILVDGVESTALSRGEGDLLWLDLPAGVHEVRILGAAPTAREVQLALPLRPLRVEVNLPGYNVAGLREDGRAEATLRLSREDPAEQQPTLAPGQLPSFLQVWHTLHLGIEWQVETQVQRLSPMGTPIVAKVPVPLGGRVTTDEAHVVDGLVEVHLGAQESTYSFTTALSPSNELSLTAASTAEWVEAWRLDAGQMWHVEPSGIAVVQHQSPQGRWLPEWRPWPGETVKLQISRPVAVPGPTLTLDASSLELKPGTDLTDGVWRLRLRSSRGGQHTVLLPEGAVLQSVSLDGQASPVRQKGREVTLPLVPGTRNAELRFQEPQQGMDFRIKSPTLDLGQPSVNHRIQVTLPPDRWVLLAGGPRMGPAVLYWALLPVLLIVSFGLGRLSWTPLKARHWFLLGIGLSQTPFAAAMAVGGWLLILGLRGRRQALPRRWIFNLTQLGLALFTVVALILLFEAVRHGLLGIPDMQIQGNGSSAFDLHWYADRVANEPPRVWVVSVPIFAFRLLMLVWALWLAFALLRWLPWGFSCLAHQGLWRAREDVARKDAREDVARKDVATGPQGEGPGV